MNNGMLIIQFLVLTAIVSGVLIFFLKKVLFDSTQGAVNRLNKETEDVRVKQEELNVKIKAASEELEKRKQEAKELAAKMAEEAENQAKEEKAKMIEKAREESEEILAKAQRTKDDLRKVITKEVEMQLAGYTSQILSKVLSKKSTQILHEAFLDDFLENLKNVSMDIVTQEIDTADVVVAAPMSDQFKQKFSDLIQKRLNRRVQLQVKEDKSLVGGAILRLGSLALDGSLKNLMHEESTALKERIENS